MLELLHGWFERCCLLVTPNPLPLSTLLIESLFCSGIHPLGKVTWYPAGSKFWTIQASHGDPFSPEHLCYSLMGHVWPRPMGEVTEEGFFILITATWILSEDTGLGPHYVPFWPCVASRKMTPADVQSLIPHPQSRWACSLTWQRGITVAGRAKVGRELTLNLKMILWCQIKRKLVYAGKNQ